MGFTVRRLAACAISLSALCLVTAHVVPENMKTMVRPSAQKAKMSTDSGATDDDFNGHYKRFFELVKMHDACPKTIVHKEAIMGGSFAIIPHHSMMEDGHMCQGDGELTLKSYGKTAASTVSTRWDHVLQHSVINSIFKQVLTSLSKYYEGSEIKGRTCGKRVHVPGVSVLFTKDPTSISKAFHIDAPKGTKFMMIGAPDMLCVYIAPGTNIVNRINVGDETILVNGEDKANKEATRAIPTTMAPVKTTTQYKATIPVKTTTQYKTTAQMRTKTLYKTTAQMKTNAPYKTTTSHKATTHYKATTPVKTTTQHKTEAPRSMDKATPVSPARISKHTLLKKLGTTGGQFDIFLGLVKMSGASSLLMHRSRKFTLFAPSDEAFIKTAADFGHKATSEKSAAVFLLNTFSKIAGGNPLEVIQKIVSYHILMGQTNKKELMMKSQLDAASGQNIHRNIKAPLVLIDHATKVPDAMLVEGKLDIMCQNGVIHVIDRVMFPFEAVPKKLLVLAVPIRGDKGAGGGTPGNGGSSSGGGSGRGGSGSSGSKAGGSADDGSGKKISSGGGAEMKGPTTGEHEGITAVVTDEKKAGREMPKIEISNGASGGTGSGVSGNSSVSVDSGDGHKGVSTGEPDKKPLFIFNMTPKPAANASLTPSPTPSSSPSPTPSPTPTPSPLPITSTSAYNATASSPTPTPDSSATCFPADAVVTLADGTEKSMSALKIGERVQTGRGEITEVYAFTHADSSVHPVFVKLSTKYGSLSATASHYLHIRDRGLIAAGRVAVGDALERGDGTAAIVETVSFVESQGLYNPQTLNGNILVDGFRTSTFTTAIKPSIANVLLAPMRGLYRFGAAESFLTLPYGGGRIADWIVSLKA